MPGVSKSQRAEAKYNVTLDFPHLGLHSAASSGNLGLVTYALDHGQPVNSVVDGVLPLHVASSGGNDLIVRLLIERGADVNAPRLPRKYSSDKHRTTSAPIVGTSGSTPLHFAAANGHEQVVLTLLLHGAHPDRPDKHGVTPEAVAWQNGWPRCAEILSKWTHEKDRDLREREAISGTVSAPAPEPENISYRSDFESRVREKKLKVKSSIDNAMNMLKPPFPTPPHDGSYMMSPPIVGSASLQSSPLAATEFPDNQGRRPSLPQIYDTVPHSVHSHSLSLAQGSSRHHGKYSGRPSISSSRRPRSAGTDADSSPTPGRLRGKLSLLSMFKKSAGESASSMSSLAGAGTGGPPTPESRDSFTSSGYASASSSSAVTSASASPAPEREHAPRERSRGPSAHSPLRTRASEVGPLSSAAGSSPSIVAPSLSTVPSNRSRMGSPSESSTVPPLAVELHRKLSAERLRTRSTSGSSSTQQPVPPGILRPHGPHGRSASSGQSTMQVPAVGEPAARSLRFETSKRSGLNLNLKTSVSSLKVENTSAAASPRSPSSQTRLRERERDPSADATNYRHRNYTIIDDEDEDGYGEVISPCIGLGLALPPAGTAELKTDEGHIDRSPSQSPGQSPLPSPIAPQELGFDCPFSINRPPPEPLSPDAAPSSQSRDNLLGIHGFDNRARGDSFGSMSTSTEASLPQTPGPGPMLGLDNIRAPLELHENDSSTDIRTRAESAASHRARTLSPARSRGHVALDIDIRAISSHAQAEALVQRAQKSIIDMEDVDIELPGLGLSGNQGQGTGLGLGSGNGALPVGRTPLSAKLAAYGESLAIERRFKEKEEREKTLGGDLRKLSLEEKPGATRRGKSRRPHTADGDTPDSAGALLSPHRTPSIGHKPSFSGSIAMAARAPATSPNGRPLRHPASQRTLPHISSLDERSAPRIVRSRTPDPAGVFFDEPLPLVGGGTSFGVPLSRVSTAPPRHASPDIVTQRTLSEQERERARANKLMKMGLLVHDSLPRAHAAYGHARNGGGSGGGGGKQRFGGFKGFVQTLTGKS